METQAGAQESLVYLAIKFNSSRRGGFPSWAAEASSRPSRSSTPATGQREPSTSCQASFSEPRAQSRARIGRATSAGSAVDRARRLGGLSCKRSTMGNVRAEDPMPVSATAVRFDEIRCGLTCRMAGRSASPRLGSRASSTPRPSNARRSKLAASDCTRRTSTRTFPSRGFWRRDQTVKSPASAPAKRRKGA